MSHPGEILLHAHDDIHAQFLVRHLPSAELEVNFDLVSLREEIFGMANLCDVIMLVNIHPELDFLHLPGCIFLILLLLGKIVSELSEVHNPADRRLGVRCDLDEIESEGTSLADGFIQSEDSELLVGRSDDHTHLAGADSLIDTDIL
jgi:hypothetical protein